MRTIPLSKGKEALVDDSDFEELSKHKWHAFYDGCNWYARRRTGKSGGVFMHNELMQPPGGVFVDHEDRNGLNNQRRNFRICTHAQNCGNQFKTRSNKSGFKGVSWKKANKKWCAQIRSGGKVVHLGLFSDPREAAMAYDKAADVAFGVFALTNQKLGLLQLTGLRHSHNF